MDIPYKIPSRHHPRIIISPLKEKEKRKMNIRVTIDINLSLLTLFYWRVPLLQRQGSLPLLTRGGLSWVSKLVLGWWSYMAGYTCSCLLFNFHLLATKYVRCVIAIWQMVFIDFLIMLGDTWRLSSSSMLVCMELWTPAIDYEWVNFPTLCFDCFDKGVVIVIYFILLQWLGLCSFHEWMWFLLFVWLDWESICT